MNAEQAGNLELIVAVDFPRVDNFLRAYEFVESIPQINQSTNQTINQTVH